jgi:hypothetical protein
MIGVSNLGIAANTKESSWLAEGVAFGPTVESQPLIIGR